MANGAICSAHQSLDSPDLANKKRDIAGGPLVDKSNIGVLGDEKAHHTSSTGTPSEKGIGISAEGDEPFGGDIPTAEERRTLRKVGEPLPKAAFLVAIVELCERFTYYGASGLFQNYIQRPLDGSEGRGALGMGHKGATGLNTFFQFWCYGMHIRFSFL